MRERSCFRCGQSQVLTVRERRGAFRAGKARYLRRVQGDLMEAPISFDPHTSPGVHMGGREGGSAGTDGPPTRTCPDQFSSKQISVLTQMDQLSLFSGLRKASLV